VPWRDGGRGKRKAVAWRKQAVHAVEEFPEESGDIVELTYSFPNDHSAAESIYLFDQRIARTGMRYQVELRGSGFSSFFVIRVPASCVDRVSAIIAQIGKR
jgi:hypothetical protein